MQWADRLGSNAAEVQNTPGDTVTLAGCCEIPVTGANRMRYSINTNGALVTEKALLSLSHSNRRRRLSSIQVSIDGSCAEVHDKSRG